VPIWATWYGSDDIKRIFNKLYGDAGPIARKARQPFSEEAIAEAIAWNQEMVFEFPNWTSERMDAQIKSANTRAKQLGLIGLNRTLYSPAYVAHILRNYHRFSSCLTTVGQVTIEQQPQSEMNFTLCFESEFPKDAVAIKTNWERMGFGFQVSAFDSDANQLAASFRTGEWGQSLRKSDPDAESIIEMETGDGSKFRLSALHVMTKESRDWHWISLWWSDRPNEDFGADRPKLVEQWNNYKMCNTLTFDATHQQFEDLQQFQSLKAAFEVIAENLPGKSWCSNPFLEQGHDNFKTNCIGCHQHGGSLLSNEDILARGAVDGQFALTKVRRNFPADYAWSWNRNPENISQFVIQQISYFDLYD
jgi:hypothetical protein